MILCYLFMLMLVILFCFDLGHLFALFTANVVLIYYFANDASSAVSGLRIF